MHPEWRCGKYESCNMHAVHTEQSCLEMGFQVGKIPESEESLVNSNAGESLPCIYALYLSSMAGTDQRQHSLTVLHNIVQI